MEIVNNRPCIISCGIGNWYPAGIDRLKTNLLFHGYAGDMLLYKDYPPGCPEHSGPGQYNFKVYAFEEAFKQGYKIVIWVDASFWAVRNPMPLLDYVNEHGIYSFKSGYSLAETATDALCEYANVNRNDLTIVSEFATGLVGINIENPRGIEFFMQWKKYMEDGMFGGHRFHDPADSRSPLFKFSRQDQSAASMILHKMGITTAGEDQDFQAYYGTNYSESQLIFFIQGI